MDKFYLVTFQNTHEAIKAEREALKKNVRVIVVPTPTHITKSCGISLKTDEKNIKSIIKLIELQNINVKKIYLVDGESINPMTIGLN
ncbi:DUF3343 domain-containing protein [Clostridium psychrophilum]|uniref:DUF3343 domain-containing protein n=1 Tax=Clostridium psychrophilum TaxID=132926 RepID=UPI001C0E260F|nr:DUF3343 domain-containing protein [Clostridium psychrophilum]MBU3182382.1 DUF3343 domain-containing protein [Clostridium psychrophilum]